MGLVRPHGVVQAEQTLVLRADGHSRGEELGDGDDGRRRLAQPAQVAGREVHVLQSERDAAARLQLFPLELPAVRPRAPLVVVPLVSGTATESQQHRCSYVAVGGLDRDFRARKAHVPRCGSAGPRALGRSSKRRPRQGKVRKQRQHRWEHVHVLIPEDLS